MTRLGIARFLSVLPALAMLLVQSSLSFGAAAMPAGGAAGLDRSLVSLIGDAGSSLVVICTPSGLMVVDLNGDGAPQPLKPRPNGCEWCFGFGSLTLPTPPDIVSRTSFDAVPVSFTFPPVTVPVPAFIRTGFSSRAPPL